MDGILARLFFRIPDGQDALRPRGLAGGAASRAGPATGKGSIPTTASQWIVHAQDQVLTVFARRA